MSQALYRKYRPKSIEEIKGQDHITTTLKHALKSGNVSHAYLFTGPRGVGKTSIARILAYQINDLPYDEKATQLDIIEIDAASNRRIDEIRDLRDKIHIMPSTGKFKVYIIDEVHMLTREAFNALLKTLEEPPAHVVFILATTEAHKLPATIVSRTQRFSFKPISTEDAVTQLKAIAKAEKISIDDEALELIAIHGEGSFRDSISLLDQLQHSDSKIDVKAVQRLLGVASDRIIKKLYEVVFSGEPTELLTLLEAQYGEGIQAASLASQLSLYIRTQLITTKALQTPQTSHLLQQLLLVGSSLSPARFLEIILLEFQFQRSPVEVSVQPVKQVAPQPAETLKPKETKPVEMPVAAKPEPKPQPKKETEPVKEVKKAPVKTGDATFDLDLWPSVLASLKAKYNTLYGILRMADVNIDGDTLTLGFKFAFHQKQINEAKNRTIISDIIHEKTGSHPKLVCVVASEQKVKVAKQSPKPVADISNVSTIFGGAEVLDT